MATVCKITLDTTEYRKELDAVVEKSRAAAGSLANLPNKQVSVTADTAQAKADAEKLTEELTAQPVEISADVVAETVEISRLKQEIAKLEEKEIKLQTKVVDDDITHLKGDLAALEKKDVSIRTEAETAEIDKLKAVIASLEKRKIEIKTEVKSQQLDTLRNKLKQLETGTKQLETASNKTRSVFSRLIPDSLRSKAAQAFGAIRSEMNKTQGGAGNFLSKFLAGGGAIGIIAAGIASLGKIVGTVYRNWIGGMKETGELAQRNAADIRETAAANEQLRQKSDGYMSRLAELSSSEQLSNSNKAEARKLIEDLIKSYGDLGVKLDETTGKLTGVDEAMVKKLQRDKDKRIAEMEAELKQLQSDNAAQRDIRDNAGLKVWGRRGQQSGLFAELTLFGEADIKEAGQKIAENDKRIMELRKLIHEQRSTDPAAEYRAKRQAENADLAEAYGKNSRSFEQRKSDDAFNAAKDIDVKIANRKKLIDAELKDRKRLEAEATLNSAQTDYERARLTGNRDGMLTAEKQILLAKQTILASDEKIYAYEKQIDDLSRQQAEAYNKLNDQAKFELDYNKLIVAGELEKAEALKLEKELKEQNLKLSEEEKKKILEQRAAMGKVSLQKNLQEQAYGLYGEAMSRAGRGREFEEQKALRDARRAKGGELSEEESELVKQLAAISFAMSNMREASLGDTSIKTNSLTARGGFAGGAKMPESDKINREIANTNKQQLEQMRQIAAICEKLGTF